MGQKTHPKGFRLVTTQKHLSEWYGDKLIYPSLIEEDFVIREKKTIHFQNSYLLLKLKLIVLIKILIIKNMLILLFMHYFREQKKCIEKLVNILLILWIHQTQRLYQY